MERELHVYQSAIRTMMAAIARELRPPLPAYGKAGNSAIASRPVCDIGHQPALSWAA